MRAKKSMNLQEFKRKFLEREISVDSLKAVKRLKSFDFDQIDVNDDGTIQGEEEIERLFQILQQEDGFDNEDQLVVQRSLGIGFSIPKTTHQTKAGKILSIFDAMTTPSLVDDVEKDPLAKFEVLQTGPQKGERIDTQLKRSIKTLSLDDIKDQLHILQHLPPEELERIANGSTQLIGNFSHESQFWVAVVPSDAIQKMIFQQVPFSKWMRLAAHAQVRFKLHPGKEIKLIPQKPKKKQTTKTISDLAFSTEATGTKGVLYSLVKGVRGFFANTHRMKSLQDVVNQSIQWKLDPQQFLIEFVNQKFDQQESYNQFLQMLFDHSNDVGMTEEYHTRTNNCDLNILDPLDKLIGYKRSLINMDWCPGIMYDTLKKREKCGIRVTKLPSLNEELGFAPSHKKV